MTDKEQALTGMTGPHADTLETTNVPLVIVALATCLALVVFTTPLTTLDAMTVSLGLGTSAQAWVMSAMPLGAACGLLTAGAFGDTLGRKRTFVGGLWLTVISSIAAALSPNGPFLIIMRIVQGLGSAGIMSCGLGLLGQIYTGARLRQAAGIWAAALGAGVAAGPIIASLLLPLGDWQAIHWLIALVCTALAAAAMPRLPESPRADRRIDLSGSILLTLGLACLMSALTEVRLGSVALVFALLVAGAGLLAAFVRQEGRVENPILQIDLFRHADFTGATLAAFASGAGVLALMTLVPTVLARGFGVSPLLAAVILLSWSGVTIFSALWARYLPHTFSSRQRVIFSILGCALGQILLFGLDRGSGWLIALPGLLICGISNGVLNASLGHEAVRTVPPARVAMGSATNNTARYLGSSMGIALISVLIAGAVEGRVFIGWHQAVLVTTGFGIAGVAGMLLASLFSKRAGSTTGS